MKSEKIFLNSCELCGQICRCVKKGGNIVDRLPPLDRSQKYPQESGFEPLAKIKEERKPETNFGKFKEEIYPPEENKNLIFPKDTEEDLHEELHYGKFKKEITDSDNVRKYTDEHFSSSRDMSSRRQFHRKFEKEIYPFSERESEPLERSDAEETCESPDRGGALHGKFEEEYSD